MNHEQLNYFQELEKDHLLDLVLFLDCLKIYETDCFDLIGH